MTKGKNKVSPKYGLSRRNQKKEAAPFVDYDYLNTLSPDELAWLDQFTHEFYRARFPSNAEPLHSSKQAKRDVYATDNARRRDLWNKSTRIDETANEAAPSPEDAIIAAIDKDDSK